MDNNVKKYRDATIERDKLLRNAYEYSKGMVAAMLAAYLIILAGLIYTLNLSYSHEAILFVVLAITFVVLGIFRKVSIRLQRKYLKRARSEKVSYKIVDMLTSDPGFKYEPKRSYYTNLTNFIAYLETKKDGR